MLENQKSQQRTWLPWLFKGVFACLGVAYPFCIFFGLSHYQPKVFSVFLFLIAGFYFYSGLQSAFQLTSVSKAASEEQSNFSFKIAQNFLMAVLVFFWRFA